MREADLLRAVDHEVDLFPVRIEEADVAALGGELEIEMIGALLGVVVSAAVEIAFGGDEGEGREDALVGPTDGLIAQRVSAQIDRPGCRVVEFDKIL